MIHTPRHFLAPLFGCLVLTGLAGCMSHHVQELPPANYSIAGVWELNPALSSDADKALAAVQPKLKGERGRSPGPGPGNGSGPDDKPPPEVINDPTTDLPPIDISNNGRGGGMLYGNGGRDERTLYRPPLDFQVNALLGGQWLKIRQSDTEVSIVNAATSHTYTPGERSVVSVPSGVADQVTGWSGRDYRVFLNPQIGPAVKESYTLSPDGRQLLVRIEVSAEGRNKALKVTRTYDRSTRDPDSLKQNLQVTLPPPD